MNSSLSNRASPANSPAPAVASRRYDLIAIDLDGTLLNRVGEPSLANIAALHAARAVGLRVIICTGRGLVECAHVLRAIDQHDPVVVAGGSIVACPTTSRTLHRASIDQTIVSETVDALLAHDHAALVLKDPVEAGYDYLVIQGERRVPLDPVTKWWFASMNVQVRFADNLADDPHPEHTVRVGACGISGTMSKIRAILNQSLGDRAFVHHFPAVVAPDDASLVKHDHPQRADAHDRKLHVLEVFDPRANKWDALQHVARQFNIQPSRIAAIGDEINDVAMLKGAALGIAMANAVPEVKAVAHKHTHHHDHDGVAHAINKLLTGEW